MERNVTDYGAVAIGVNDPIPGDAAAFRAANREAIQLAIDLARRAGGGAVVIGPGVYHTDGPVGLDLDEDSNVGISFKGVGTFPTMIWSNDPTQPCFKLHTTAGNIRAFVMEAVTLRGGKHNLSLHKAAYCKFRDVKFWGICEWGIQSYQGQQNKFIGCNFAEVATDSVSPADSALFLSCHHTELINCNYGESGGGIVVKSGMLTIDGGTGYGAWYHGNEGHRWDTGLAEDLGLQGLPESLFSSNGGNLKIDGGTFDLGHSFITSRSSEVIQVTGTTIRSGWSPSTPPGIDFDGFINFSANPAGKTALNVTGNLFQLRSLGLVGDSGHILNEAPGGAYKGCVVANNTFLVGEYASLTPLMISAPSLFDSTNGNIAENVIKTTTGATVE